MLDLSPFDTLLYRSSYFAGEVVNRQRKPAKISLKFLAVYEITYNQLPGKFLRHAYRNAENAAHHYLNDMYKLVKISKPTVLPYLFRSRIEQPLIEMLSKVHQEEQDGIDIDTERTKVIELLKHFLVWMYAEVCEAKTRLLKTPEVPLFQIYEQYFQMEEPAPAIIHERIYPSLKTGNTAGANSNKPSSIPIELTYQQLVQTPEQFQQVEEKMMENGIIDGNKTILPAHGNRRYLAAVYVQLIHNGYFHTRIFPENRSIRPIDIRKFLDKRYGVNLQKQFNHWMKNKTEHATFMSKYFWLENLPPCTSQ